MTHCPTGALRERDDTTSFYRALEREDTVVVAQIAPAVRAAWGESLGLSREEAAVGKIADALRRMGVDYVFDTSFSADLTIMEEAHEFVENLPKRTGGRYDVHFLLSWMGKFYENSVSTDDRLSLHGKISTADVWSRNEERLCQKAWN